MLSSRNSIILVVIESGGGSASGNDSVAIVPDACCAVATVRQLPGRRGFERPDRAGRLQLFARHFLDWR